MRYIRTVHADMHWVLFFLSFLLRYLLGLEFRHIRRLVNIDVYVTPPFSRRQIQSIIWGEVGRHEAAAQQPRGMHLKHD